MKRLIPGWLCLVLAVLALASFSKLAAADSADKDADKVESADAAAEPATDAATAPDATTDATADAATDAASPASESLPKTQSIRSPYRTLAPWVMKKVDPMRSLGETVSYHNAVEILAVNPDLDWAKNVSFRHDVSTLEFEFKPMRMIWVDQPHVGGNMERKLIWYMVYKVTNPGKVFHPVEDVKVPYELDEKKAPPLLYRVDSVDQPVHFTPEFLMDTYQRTRNSVISNKQYPDRVIPVAMTAIRLREDPNRKFLTSVEMCRDIAVGETLWGIATWEDVDLTTFKFSVFVYGLTNAYRWKDKPDAYKAGDPVLTGREISRRVLKLNFWRPADKYFEHEEEIRYGFPGGLDYEWVYR
jgi:hypothetical protein